MTLPPPAICEPTKTEITVYIAKLEAALYDSKTTVLLHEAKWAVTEYVSLAEVPQC